MEDILNTIIKFSSRKIETVVDKDRVRKVDTPYICADTTKLNTIMQNENIKNDLDKVLKDMFEFYKKD